MNDKLYLHLRYFCTASTQTSPFGGPLKGCLGKGKGREALVLAGRVEEGRN